MPFIAFFKSAALLVFFNILFGIAIHHCCIYHKCLFFVICFCYFLSIIITWPFCSVEVIRKILIWYNGDKFSFFINHFMCLHLKWSPPPFPLHTLPIPSHSPLSLHLLLPSSSSITLHWDIKPPQDWGLPSHWCQIEPSSATYAAGAMGPSLCTLWLVV